MSNNAGPIPVTVISGYLGAGKTSLVNHILRHSRNRRVVVLVNDFGDLPIDCDLIESREGNTINLSNGCACCSMGGDLFNALVDVLNMVPAPEHLLIEASGVADPARMANIARAEPDLQLDAIISLVDAARFGELVSDDRIGSTLIQQLKTSDIIISNKIDLVDSQKAIRELKTALEQTVPNAIIITSSFGKVPPDILLGVRLHPNDDAMFTESNEIHSSVYERWSAQFGEISDIGLFEKNIAGLGRDVLRLKGIVFAKSQTNPYAVHSVGTKTDVFPLTNYDWNTQRHSRLIAIGLKGELDKLELQTLIDC